MKSVDHFLRIGTIHKICEDYIISGFDPIPFVILSDGCSSSYNTDMGSRILTHLAKEYLKNEIHDLDRLDYNKMGNWIIHNSGSIIRTMGLDKSCLDATLIISYIFNDLIYTYMYGDGFLITINLEDRISFFEVLYGNNAPYYLSYKIDSKRDNLYKNINPTKTVNYTIPNNIKESKIYCVSTLESYNSDFIKILPISDYKSVFIASDGLTSFINENGEKYDIDKVLEEVTSFKNIKGEFIKRRMGSKKGVINTLQAKGISHYDDLSIGGFIRS